MVVEGSVIGGKYRVDRVLARGGMGLVVAATHLQLDQPVALKVLLPELLEDPLAVERFLREGKAAAQLHSEHVCRVLDVSVLDDGVPYLVMELLEGSDLQQLLGRHERLPVTSAVTYVLQACVGLAEAHARGIVHRDLKPANLFVTQGPDEAPLVKVLDFGIAKVTLGVKPDLTSTTSVIGSPHYMAPEQLRASREADLRSDMWSLGAILHELLSGQKAFDAGSLMELSLRIAMDPPAPLPGVAPALAEVIRRCLEKEPAARYDDLADLADALAAAVDEPAARQLAAEVTRVYFAGRPDERTARQRRITDRAMARAAAARPSAGRTARETAGAAMAATSESISGTATTMDMPSEQIPPMQPRPRRKRRLLVAALSGAVLASAIAMLVMPRWAATERAEAEAAPKLSTEPAAAPRETTTAAPAREGLGAEPAPRQVPGAATETATETATDAATKTATGAATEAAAETATEAAADDGGARLAPSPHAAFESDEAAPRQEGRRARERRERVRQRDRANAAPRATTDAAAPAAGGDNAAAATPPVPMGPPSPNLAPPAAPSAEADGKLADPLADVKLVDPFDQ